MPRGMALINVEHASYRLLLLIFHIFRWGVRKSGERSVTYLQHLNCSDSCDLLLRKRRCLQICRRHLIGGFTSWWRFATCCSIIIFFSFFFSSEDFPRNEEILIWVGMKRISSSDSNGGGDGVIVRVQQSSNRKSVVRKLPTLKVSVVNTEVI